MAIKLTTTIHIEGTDHREERTFEVLGVERPTDDLENGSLTLVEDKTGKIYKLTQEVL